MKKTLIIILISLSASFFSNANPLFFPQTTRKVIKGDYEYFYDRQGNLLGCEECGSAGSVFKYDGNNYVEVGYFIKDNDVWLYYQTGTGRYMGKYLNSYSVKYGYNQTYSVRTDSYVDSKNRPIATYKQVDTPFSDTMQSLINPFASSRVTVYELQGSVRRYNY